jgi:hypothetical protein
MATLIKVTLDYERSTKRFHVYVAPEGTLIPPKIYVPLVKGVEPTGQVTLTVETADEVPAVPADVNGRHIGGRHVAV